jgi:chemotaxis family two-component system response regulator Rcp1
VRDVLAIEDDPLDAELLEVAFLEICKDVRFHKVSNGAEALAYLMRRPPYENADRPALVLLDLKLPGLGGLEVLRAVRGDEALRVLPIVVLSTSESRTDVAASYRLGANCYISKPLGLAGAERVAEEICRFWLETVTLPSVED